MCDVVHYSDTVCAKYLGQFRDLQNGFGMCSSTSNCHAGLHVLIRTKYTHMLLLDATLPTCYSSKKPTSKLFFLYGPA